MATEGSEGVKEGEAVWLRVAFAGGLGLAALLFLLRKPRPARWSLALANACLDRLAQARLARRVGDLMARSGRDA